MVNHKLSEEEELELLLNPGKTTQKNKPIKLKKDKLLKFAQNGISWNDLFSHYLVEHSDKDYIEWFREYDAVRVDALLSMLELSTEKSTVLSKLKMVKNAKRTIKYEGKGNEF